MTFQTVPVNIAGPSYQSRSSPLSSQETRNLYHAIVEEGKDKVVLHSFPGLKKKGGVSGKDRGGRNMREIGFRVAGTALYSFDKNGVHTSLGSIPGTQRCVFTDDGTNLVIVDPGVAVYVYNGSTITTVTDTIIAGAIAATFINSQIVYTKPNLFIFANVGDPTTANGLNAANAESQPDDLVRAYAFQQSIYMVGVRSNEPWWNTGEGNPPADRIDGQIMEVGCAATHSVASTDEFLYWLGDDQAVYQATGGTKSRVSSTAISHAISTYSRIDDAIGYTFTFEGDNFYALHFPTANKSWCLSESLGKKGWFEISSGTNGGSYQGTTLINVYNKNFVFDADNGNLYELDIFTFQNNGEVIQRRRIMSSINGDLLGKKGARVQMSRFEIFMEKGVGLISGQGEDPKIMIEISFDGGRSWAEKGFIRIGRMGEFDLRVELFATDTFLDAIFRITTSDPVPYEFYSGAIDLRLAGR